MADVILFRSKVYPGEVRAIRPRPPMNLLFIAAPLVADNYRVKIIDEETDVSWLEKLNKELTASTICVGISSMTGTQILGGLKFARTVKNKFDIPVVWGGLHPSILPEQTIKDDLVDIVVRGEGEDRFLRIVNALKNRTGFQDISNIWWKESGKICSNPKEEFINLSKIPILPYHLLDCEKYIRAKRSSHPNCKRIFDLQTDRGCPHRCGFCYNVNVNGRKWRTVPSGEVLEKLEYLVRRFSLDGVNFLGDNFFVDKKRVVDICTGMIKRNIKVTWHADCRIDYFVEYEDSFIELFRKSGCRVLTFGIESGSQRVLDLIHKDLTLDQVFRLNQRLKHWQMKVNYHFMAGFPGETKEDLKETYQVMLRLHKQNSTVIFLGPSVYTPYPGTPLYEKALEAGFQPPQKLQDWAKLSWDQDTFLRSREPEYSSWLMRSVNVVSSTNIAKRVTGSRLLGWWFKLRMSLIIKFNFIGPQFEEKLIRFVGVFTAFVKNIFKAK